MDRELSWTALLFGAVICVGLLAIAGGAAFATVDGNPADADSWPMEGHDPAQTATNPDAVGPDGDVGPGWIAVTGYGPGTTTDGDRVFVAGGERRGAVSAHDPDDGTLEWRTQLGDAISSKPAVENGTVYVHVVEYGPRDLAEDDHEIVALDAETGDVEWRFEATDDRYEYTTFRWKTLTIADGALYVAGTNYEDVWAQEEAFLLSIDTGGEERWRVDLGTEEASRPAVADGRVIVTADEEALAFDIPEGDEQWRATHPAGQALSAPGVDDDAVYVNARTPLELDAADGDVRTEYPVTGTNARPVAIAEDRLFVPGEPSGRWAPTHLHAVERDATAEAGAEAVAWTVGFPTEISTRPIASAETVYVGGWNGVVYALDREDGEERWSYEVNRNYMINNEPAVAGETLYVGPVDNRVYAFVDGGDARDPAVIGFISQLLPVLADLAGFFAVVALIYLGVGVVFGLAGGVAVFGVVAGLGLSRTPLRLLAARLFRRPLEDVSRAREFGGFLIASVLAVLVVGAVSALTFGTFPVNGLLAAAVVFGGAWAVLVYRWLPAHPDALDRDAGRIRRQWGVVLAVYGLLVGLLYPLVVFVILMGIYFT